MYQTASIEGLKRRDPSCGEVLAKKLLNKMKLRARSVARTDGKNGEISPIYLHKMKESDGKIAKKMKKYEKRLVFYVKIH